MRNLPISRDEGEWLVDLLEDCDPMLRGSWRHDLAGEIRTMFGMAPADKLIGPVRRSSKPFIEESFEEKLRDIWNIAIDQAIECIARAGDPIVARDKLRQLQTTEGFRYWAEQNGYHFRQQKEDDESD